MNVASGDRAAKSRAGSEAAGKRAGSESRAQERGTSAGIRNGKRRAGLEDADAADGPVPQQRGFDAGGVFEDGQIVAVAHDKALRAIKIRQSARCVQGGLIIERGIKGGVTGGGGIGGFREGVCGLEVACTPATRQSRLQRVVVGVGVVSEKLEACVAVDALGARTSDSIAESVGGNYARIGIAERAADVHGVGGRSVLGLQVVADRKSVV